MAEDLDIPARIVRRNAHAAAPLGRWSPEALAALDAVGREAIQRAARAAFERAQADTRPRVTVGAEDVQPVTNEVAPRPARVQRVEADDRISQMLGYIELLETTRREANRRLIEGGLEPVEGSLSGRVVTLRDGSQLRAVVAREVLGDAAP